MIEINAVEGNVIHIGRQGENGATTVIFDVYEMGYTDFSESNFLLYVQQGDYYYPQQVDLDVTLENQEQDFSENNPVVAAKVKWEITNINTYVLGLGKCELVYAKGTWNGDKFTQRTLEKSFIYDILVTESIPGKIQEAPTNVQNWLDNFSSMATAVQNAEQYHEEVKNWHDNVEALTNAARGYSYTAQQYGSEVNNVSIGTVTVGGPNDAAVTKTTTSNGLQLNFVIPSQGSGIIWSGVVSSLPTPASSYAEEYYLVGSNGSYNIYYSDGSNWHNLGPFSLGATVKLIQYS